MKTLVTAAIDPLTPETPCKVGHDPKFCRMIAKSAVSQSRLRSARLEFPSESSSNIAHCAIHRSCLVFIPPFHRPSRSSKLQPR